MNVIPPGAEEKLRKFLTQHKVLNPSNLPIERKSAITVSVPIKSDWMLTLRAHKESVPTIEIIVNHLQYQDSGTRRLDEYSMYGKRLNNDLKKLFNDVLGVSSTNVGNEDEFKLFRDNRGFIGNIHLNDMSTGELRDVSIEVEKTITDIRIPQEVSQKPDESIREYLVRNWWFNLSKREKASILGLSNEVIMLSGGEIEEGLNVDFQIN